MVYCVDLRHKTTGDTYMTIFKSHNYDMSWEVANNYNNIHGITEHEYVLLERGETEGHSKHPYWASVYEDYEEIIEPKEEYKMKKYTLKDYKKFCEEALICPPYEDDEQFDAWIGAHKVQIIANDCVMELEYDADTINEIEFSLKEMHEAIHGSGEATTGNTVGSEYRPATLKDIVKVAVRDGYWEYAGSNDFASYIQHFIKSNNNIGDILNCYKHISKNLVDYIEEYECDFKRLDVTDMHKVDSAMIKNTIGALICTDRELLFGITEDDKSSDIVFVMDYTLKQSGELIGWFYGQDNIDEEYIDGLIEDYKNKLFGEEN